MRKLTYLLIVVILSSCNFLNPSIMLKTDKNFKYDAFKDTLNQLKEYKISANDIIEFRMYSNDGFKLIDLTTQSVNNANSISGRTGMEYLVEFDGQIKLPIISRVPIQGLTIRQAELMLEEKYASYYIKPFVLLNVINRRVIVFPGSPGSARVIPLTNNNTTLIEALALAGGIAENGIAKKIKLIRGNLQAPEVFLIDLSTIDGIRQADMVLQANDIIYVEPKRNISRGLLTEITPILGLLTSLLIVYGLIIRPSN